MLVHGSATLTVCAEASILAAYSLCYVKENPISKCGSGRAEVTCENILVAVFFPGFSRLSCENSLIIDTHM